MLDTPGGVREVGSIGGNLIYDVVLETGGEGWRVVDLLDT